MERVAFLIEETGERVFALTNPEELMFSRHAGVRPRKYAERPLIGANQTDDPLTQAGGGVTDITLNLLFDVGLHQRERTSFSKPAGQAEVRDLQLQAHAQPVAGELTPEGGISADPQVEDVRELSAPLWQLAENDQQARALGGPAIVHLIWGAAWFVRCVVLRVAERFDSFTADGNPQRSWMRVHLRRVHMETQPRQHETQYTPPLPSTSKDAPMGARTQVKTITDPASSSRPDLLCDEIYGDTSVLHALLAYNGVDDFWGLESGFSLTAPPIEQLVGGHGD